MAYCICLSYLLFMILFPVADFAELWTYTKSPESVTAPLGDEVVFTCQTNITAERVVWWHRRSVPAGHSLPAWTEVKLLGANTRNSSPHRVNAKPNLSKLTVNLKNHSLAGEYRCVSWFGASGLASVVAKLTVPKLGAAPHLNDRHLVVAPDSLVLLRCPPPVSEPPATMVYYKVIDGRHSVIDSEIDSGGALIVRAALGTKTVYACAAENSFVNESHIYHHRITVEVRKKQHEIPTFTVDMLDEVTGKEGESITLGCAAIGFPAPRIVWKRAGGGSLPKHVSMKSPLLHISHLQTHDQGEYVCHANNEVGVAKKSVKLRVLEPPQLIPEAYNKTVQEGGSVHLLCGRVHGIPSPSLHWLINGGEVSHDASVKVSEQELEINPVEKRHAGLVQCFATNSLGSVFTASLLQVIPKQHMSQHSGNDMDLNIGGNDMSNRKHKSKGHRPNTMIPPSQPNVTRLSDESVMVRWSTQNEGLPIKFFKVQYRDLNHTQARGDRGRGSRWKTAPEIIDSHVRSYAVDGLIPDHVYRFRIAAVYRNDDNKQGPNSFRFLLQRGAQLPKAPQSPIFTHAEAVSPTEILLHWKLSANVSDDVPEPDGYYVYYRLATSAAEYTKAAVEGGKARSQLLQYLQPGTSYEIKLQSFTPTAASDFSAIVTQRTLKPVVVEKNTELTMMNGVPSTSVTSGAASNNLRLYGIAGGAVGGTVLLAGIILALVLCKKRRGCTPEKQDGTIGGGGVGGSLTEGMNGYLASPPSATNKSIITITANPLHPEVRVKT
ncbi:interference hedgehog-like isoform X2 [Arctopsyche grandis]|uniref:interference hedgehog-like isoform X2 n=1 Tax=Arctopsyche grandis TaxID=121162 RepID=UPI00406D740F